MMVSPMAIVPSPTEPSGGRGVSVDSVPRRRWMFHVHVHAAGSKLSKHLPNSLLTCRRSLRPLDPTEIVVLLIPRTLLVVANSASLGEPIANVKRHGIEGTFDHGTNEVTDRTSRQVDTARHVEGPFR